MNHFTDKKGYNAIRSQLVWRFIASQPPSNHPFGAYFTTLARGAPNLACRLRVPKNKTKYVFEFVDGGDLLPLPGHRGRNIFYSPADYEVGQERQVFSGEA